MTRTEQLEQDLKLAAKSGLERIHLNVGKFTGNNPAVLGALRRRGYRVERGPREGFYVYTMSAGQEVAAQQSKE